MAASAWDSGQVLGRPAMSQEPHSRTGGPSVSPLGLLSWKPPAPSQPLSCPHSPLPSTPAVTFSKCCPTTSSKHEWHHLVVPHNPPPSGTQLDPQSPSACPRPPGFSFHRPEGRVPSHHPSRAHRNGGGGVCSSQRSRPCCCYGNHSPEFNQQMNIPGKYQSLRRTC